MSHRGQRYYDSEQIKSLYGIGLNCKEVAAHLGIDEKTVRRYLREAKVKIRKGFRGEHTEESKRKFSESFKRQYVRENHPRWRGADLNSSCDACGKTFRKRYENSGTRFCSKDCMTKVASGPAHWNWQGGITKLEFDCALCGVPVVRQGVSKSKEHFCSDCKGKAYIGERSPRWAGAHAHWRDYPEGWNGALKEKIRERDGFACRLCGTPQASLQRKLDVHHIDKNKQNIAEDNLVSLCGPCHHRLHNNEDVERELQCQIAG